jgi:hypothetical protein
MSAATIYSRNRNVRGQKKKSRTRVQRVLLCTVYMQGAYVQMAECSNVKSESVLQDKKIRRPDDSEEKRCSETPQGTSRSSFATGGLEKDQTAQRY